MAGAISSSSLEIKPAPRSMPMRSRVDSAVSQAGVLNGQLCGRNGELDVARHVLPTFTKGLADLGKCIVFQIEVRDLGAGVGGQPGNSKGFEGADRTLSFSQE